MRKLLIESLDEFTSHISIAESFDFEELRSTVAMVQKQEIENQLMGSDLLEYFLGIQDGEPGDDIDDKIIREACAAIANKALINAIAVLNINVTSGGFTVNQSAGKGVASMNRVEALKDQLNLNFQHHYSELVSLLVAHTSEFEGYANTVQRKSILGGFVNYPEEFNSGLVGIRLNWYAIFQMRSYMRSIEYSFLPKILGSELYADMSSKIMSGTSLGVYAPILPFIHKAVASQTFADTCLNLGIRVDERGTYLSFIRNANDPNQTQALTPRVEGTMALSHKQKAERDWLALAEHLMTNADTYTLFKNSTAYTDRTNKPEAITPSGNAVWYGL